MLEKIEQIHPSILFVTKTFSGGLFIFLLHLLIYFTLSSQSKIVVSNKNSVLFSWQLVLLFGFFFCAIATSRRVVVGIITSLLLISSTVFWISIFPLAPQIEKTITIHHFFGRGIPGMNFLILPLSLVIFFLITFIREDADDVFLQSSLHKAGKYIFYLLFACGVLLSAFVLMKTQQKLLFLSLEQMFLFGTCLFLGAIVVGLSYLGKHITSKSLLIVMSIALVAMSLSMIRILQG